MSKQNIGFLKYYTNKLYIYIYNLNEVGKGLESPLTYRRLQAYSNIGCVRRAGAKLVGNPS